MSNLSKILNEISENSSLKRLDYWDEIFFGNDCYFVNCVLWRVFLAMIEYGKKGTYLSKWEFREILNDDESLDRLFDLININSKNISYDEFLDFCLLGTKQNIIELTKALQIYDSFIEASTNKTIAEKFTDEVFQNSYEYSDNPYEDSDEDSAEVADEYTQELSDEGSPDVSDEFTQDVSNEFTQEVSEEKSQSYLQNLWIKLKKKISL